MLLQVNDVYELAKVFSMAKPLGDQTRNNGPTSNVTVPNRLKVTKLVSVPLILTTKLYD